MGEPQGRRRPTEKCGGGSVRGGGGDRAVQGEGGGTEQADIWNPDHLDENRCFGMYRYIPVYTGIYRYIPKSRLSYLVCGSMNGFTFSPVAHDAM